MLWDDNANHYANHANFFFFNQGFLKFIRCADVIPASVNVLVNRAKLDGQCFFFVTHHNLQYWELQYETAKLSQQS